jgi:hypothetical protein
MSTGAFTLADIDKPAKGKFSSSDIDTPDRWSLPTSWKDVWSRLSQKLPAPIGGSEERETAEGAPIAAQGLTAIGTAGLGVEAIAARSLAPLYPIARGILGAWAGK